MYTVIKMIVMFWTIKTHYALIRTIYFQNNFPSTQPPSKLLRVVAEMAILILFTSKIEQQ